MKNIALRRQKLSEARGTSRRRPPRNRLGPFGLRVRGFCTRTRPHQRRASVPVVEHGNAERVRKGGIVERDGEKSLALVGAAGPGGSKIKHFTQNGRGSGRGRVENSVV